MSGRSWVVAPLLLITVFGCNGPADTAPDSRLLFTGHSAGIAWLPSGLYSIEVPDGLANAELQRVDPDTGEARIIPWPQMPCPEAFRGSLTGRDGKLYVARTCNPIVGTRAYDYIVYEPAADSWSTLATGTWDEPVHGSLAWHEAAQEGIFTTPDQSCSSVYRLTRQGPSFIQQIVPTPLGNVDTQAGLTMQTGVADCLRDGRILGAPINQQGQIALMVSPVKGPPGPERLEAPSALVIANWRPGLEAPFSDFRTMSAKVESASPPAWSATGTTVFWSGDEAILQGDVDTGVVTKIAPEGASEIAASPDGSRIALRRGILTEDFDSRSEIRILDLPTPS